MEFEVIARTDTDAYVLHDKVKGGMATVSRHTLYVLMEHGHHIDGVEWNGVKLRAGDVHPIHSLISNIEVPSVKRSASSIEKDEGIDVEAAVRTGDAVRRTQIRQTKLTAYITAVDISVYGNTGKPAYRYEYELRCNNETALSAMRKLAKQLSFVGEGFYVDTTKAKKALDAGHTYSVTVSTGTILTGYEYVQQFAAPSVCVTYHSLSPDAVCILSCGDKYKPNCHITGTYERLLQELASYLRRIGIAEERAEA